MRLLFPDIRNIVSVFKWRSSTNLIKIKQVNMNCELLTQLNHFTVLMLIRYLIPPCITNFLHKIIVGELQFLVSVFV